MIRIAYLAVLSFPLLVLSCSDAYGPAIVLSGSIEYTLSGGWAGGIHTQLSVDRAAHVVLHSTSPPLEGDLTQVELTELEVLFADIWNQPDTLLFGCMDDVTHEIEWTDMRGTKTVVVDGCSLHPPGGGNGLPTLNRIVEVLNAIAARITGQRGLDRVNLSVAGMVCSHPLFVL